MADDQKPPEWVTGTLYHAPGLAPQLRLYGKTTWETIRELKTIFSRRDYDDELNRLALGLALVALDPGAAQATRDDWGRALWDHIADTSGRGALGRGVHIVGVDSVQRGKAPKQPTLRHRRLPTPQKRRRATFDPETYTDGVPEIVKAARSENAQGRMLN